MAVTKLEQMAEVWFLRNRELNMSGDGVFSPSEAFEAGFRAAQEMAMQVWERTGHEYCDFYGEGLDQLQKLDK